jgi:hypothetical protein
MQLSNERISYTVTRSGEGLAFENRADAVRYAMRKHQEAADDFTVSRDVFAISEGHHVPLKSMLAYYLVLCPRSLEQSVHFDSRASAERDALVKCRGTGDEYKVLYMSENNWPNVLCVATARMVDGKAVIQCALEAALPTTVLPTA